MDYGIGTGKGRQIMQPAFILSRCPVGGVVFLTQSDYPNSKLILLGSFVVESDFLNELFQNLRIYPTTDFIYFRNEEDAINFPSTIDEGIRLSTLGDPALPAHIIYRKCTPGSFVVFAKHELAKREIVLLDYYRSLFDFTEELFERLENNLETDYIYFISGSDINDFMNFIRGAVRDDNGRPILRTTF